MSRRHPMIPGQATEIRYQRSGALAGRYYHRFKAGVRMLANRDGSVTLRGRREIHATEDAPGFWQRYGRGSENPRRRPVWNLCTNPRRRSARSRPMAVRQEEGFPLGWITFGVLLYLWATHKIDAVIPDALEWPAGGLADILRPVETSPTDPNDDLMWPW